MKNRLWIGKSLIIFGVLITASIYNSGHIRNNISLNENEVREVENLNVEENKRFVYPLGNIVGIKAKTDGVLVIGYEEKNVEYIGGIKEGDHIVEIEGIKIKNSEDVKNVLNESKKDEVKITIERNGEFIEEVIKTKKVNEEYKLGLWVRDKISGMGTLTLYDPLEGQFKALGHPITDVDTNKLLKISEGNIYEPDSVDIDVGKRNQVGKIKGEFNEEEIIGDFRVNSEYGISGSLESIKDDNVQMIEVAKKEEVTTGSAKMLFQDENKNIQSYDIKITNITNDKESYKDMTIEIVDNELIDYTGGIVQGMSGAPIIQNNKIVGAVTHVFRDNPKKGYGIFIDEMIKLEL